MKKIEKYQQSFTQPEVDTFYHQLLFRNSEKSMHFSILVCTKYILLLIFLQNNIPVYMFLVMRSFF